MRFVVDENFEVVTQSCGVPLSCPSSLLHHSFVLLAHDAGCINKPTLLWLAVVEFCQVWRRIVTDHDGRDGRDGLDGLDGLDGSVTGDG